MRVVPAMHVTFYSDVCSMWCALGDEIVDEILRRYGSRVTLDSKIALIDGGKPLDAGPEQERWYYDRCAFVTGRRFNPDWIEKKGQVTLLPNLVIVAAQKLGKGREVHAALRTAAMERGEHILQREVALSVATAAGVPRKALEAAIEDPALTEAIAASTAEFDTYRINQRPAFVMRSAIQDTVVLSGIYRKEPVFAALDAMIHDEDKYKAHAESFPPIPA